MTKMYQVFSESAHSHCIVIAENKNEAVVEFLDFLRKCGELEELDAADLELDIKISEVKDKVLYIGEV